MRRTVAWLMAFMLAASHAAAGELRTRAYLSLPLQGGPPSLGLSLTPEELGDAPAGAPAATRAGADLLRLDLASRRLSVAGLDVDETGRQLAAAEDSNLALVFWSVVGVGAVVGLVIAADHFCIAYNSQCPSKDDDPAPAAQ